LAIKVVVAALIIFCIISVVFKVMSPKELPSNFIGATLGALIGALITFVLLEGQTDIEEKKGKDIRILEKKAEIFQNYIKSVWKVWEDQIITIEEFKDLTSQYYQNLMMYLKEKSQRQRIGDALTVMGNKIGKNDYQEDILKVRASIISIIDTLSDDIGLGGKIDPDIMDKHDKIVFPVKLEKELLSKLNEALKDQSLDFKEGKHENIWVNRWWEFITFEMKKYPGIKLAIGEIGGVNPRAETTYLFMRFIAAPEITQLDEFREGASSWSILKGKVNLGDPTPEDEDKETKTPGLDFSPEGKSMKFFREEKRDFPDILAKRVLYYIREWKIGGIGLIEFLEKYLGQEHL
jgi:hypothetical protein